MAEGKGSEVGPPSSAIDVGPPLMEIDGVTGDDTNKGSEEEEDKSEHSTLSEEEGREDDSKLSVESSEELIAEAGRI